MGCLQKSVVYALGVLLAAFLLGGWSVLLGNDAAAEIAAGGIQLRKEARISMEKERLTVSLEKVTVEYEFLNRTDQDIETEVAFPVPPYEYDPVGRGWAHNFADFHLWIDGREADCRLDIRAKLRGRDYTGLLNNLGIDIQTFGNLGSEADVDKSQIGRLTVPLREKLSQVGLVGGAFGFPMWSVHKTYHWRQRFPAHKTLRIRHQYEPVIGFQPVTTAQIRSELKGVCLDPSLEKSLLALRALKLEKGRRQHGSRFREGFIYAHAQWVKFLLTTANTWRTPIKNFELIVEEPDTTRWNPQPKRVGTSVCWDSTVQRLDKDRSVGGKTNFIPTRELVVYYFLDFD
jgi:hypothetical protein